MAKFKITAEDTVREDVVRVADHIERAKEIPLIREVGSDTGSKDGFLTILALLGGGLVGGALVWAFWQVLPETDDTFWSNMNASFTVAVAIALALILVDGALNRSAAKLGRSLLIAVPAAIGAAIVFGLIANQVYSTLVESTFDALTAQGFDPSGPAFWEQFQSRNHLNRGLAWMLLGAAAGVGVGASSKSLRRILITGAGGLVGGFIGGFVFDFFQGEDLAQISGLLITGGVIGFSVSMLEQATKSSWIEITRGGMAGKQFILYQSQVTIGSSPTANVTLIKDPAIAPIAATIRRVGSTVSIIAADRNHPLSVNGVTAFDHVLQEGAVIVLGATELRFREKSRKINDAKIVRA
jgi:hypothetical protein